MGTQMTGICLAYTAEFSHRVIPNFDIGQEDRVYVNEHKLLYLVALMCLGNSVQVYLCEIVIITKRKKKQ